MKLSQEVFNKVIEDLCQAYERNITKERAKIYYDVLKDEIDDQDMQRMLPILLRECRYFPTVADIISAVRDIDYLQDLP